MRLKFPYSQDTAFKRLEMIGFGSSPAPGVNFEYRRWFPQGNVKYKEIYRAFAYSGSLSLKKGQLTSIESSEFSGVSLLISELKLEIIK